MLSNVKFLNLEKKLLIYKHFKGKINPIIKYCNVTQYKVDVKINIIKCLIYSLSDN